MAAIGQRFQVKYVHGCSEEVHGTGVSKSRGPNRSRHACKGVGNYLASADRQHAIAAADLWQRTARLGQLCNYDRDRRDETVKKTAYDRHAGAAARKP